ncbi:MAG: class I SAM-dependent methyltransferase [Opitutaceae bacterium]
MPEFPASPPCSATTPFLFSAMPTLTALLPPPSPAVHPVPPPRPSAPTGDSVSVSLPFYGRSLAEYVHGFALDLGSLRTQAVLDVGAGPSSFAVEASRRGLDVVAIDPLYGCPMTTLATHVQLDYARVAVEATRRLSGSRLAARETLELERRTAAQRFLADYESGFLHNRYIGACLPRLPFLDRSFDLVLCGHVLFGPQSPFDADQLVTACLELVRVSAGEVRIAPLTGLSPAEAESLTARLAEQGVAFERQPGRGGPAGSRSSLGVLTRRR